MPNREADGTVSRWPERASPDHVRFESTGHGRGSRLTRHESLSMIAGMDLHNQAAELLELLHQRGVALWTDGDRVHFKGPKGTVGPADLARLKYCRQQLLQLLQPATASEQRNRSADCALPCAPVSFSQLAQWNRE